MLLLQACSLLHKDEAKPKQPDIGEAMKLCRQAAGDNAERAVFDACMKDKGFRRTAASLAE